MLEHSLCDKGLNFLVVGENTDSGEKGPTLSGFHSYDLGDMGSDSFFPLLVQQTNPNRVRALGVTVIIRLGVIA